MKHFGDITKIHGDKVPIVDIITGGSPCQDLSVAGKRAGLAGERSGLFMEQIRIVKEMRNESKRRLSIQGTDYDLRHIRPRYMVWENVAGAFSSGTPKGADFRAVLEEIIKVVVKEIPDIPIPEKGWSYAGCIEGMGDDGVPFSIAWRLHDAQYWGVPQRRKRIALVADFGGNSASKILFECKSLSGNTEESKKERKDAATDVERSVRETGRCLNGWDIQSKHIQPQNGIAESLYAGECRGGGGESYVMQSISFQERAGKPGGGKGILIQNERTGALSTLNNQSVVYGISAYDSNAMKSSNPRSGIYEADTTRTLDNNGGNPACNQGGMAVVCLEGNGSRPSHRGDGYAESDTMYTLNSTEHHAVCVENHSADSRVKISEDGMVQTLSSRMVMDTYQKTTGTLSPGAHAGSYNGQDAYNDMLVAGVYGVSSFASYKEGTTSLRAQGGDNGGGSENIAVQNSVVRRLTPMECERLQGFPDHWTDIGEWVDSKGKKHKDADSPRYKALGNSIALPFWEWMADRMCKQLREEGFEDLSMASLFDGIGGFPLVYSRCGCNGGF